MPALRNSRQERFARELVKGATQRKAYRAAGYRASTLATLDANASHLTSNNRVQARYQELAAMAAAKTVVTAETIAEQLDEDRRLAFSEGQAGAAVAASMAKAKLFGLVVNKSESGQPGDFQAMQTPQDVVDKVRNELGEEAADTLAKAFVVDVSKTPTHSNPESVN